MNISIRKLLPLEWDHAYSLISQLRNITKEIHQKRQNSDHERL